MAAGGAPPVVTLVSGLPLAGQNSFTRQLSLLAPFLAGEGLPVALAGPEPGRPGHFPGLERAGPGTRILLGYPDQFPFLRAAGGAGRCGRPAAGRPAMDPSSRAAGEAGPLFLWAQFSRPPDPRSLRGVSCVPLTPATARFLRASGGAPAAPRVCPPIPHGVDSRELRPPEAGERARDRREWGLEGRFVAGTVAANSARKRLDLVIEAFARFARREERAVLLIKTDRRVSPEGSDLLERARRAGIEARTRLLTEPLPAADLARLYGRMDVYLNLSEWEGFCLPVAEAMACGVPVVCLPGQGPGEIVPYRELRVDRFTEAREGGAVLLQADPQAAADALLAAARRPDLLDRLSARGRLEAERRYDIRRVARLWARRIARGLSPPSAPALP